MAGQSLFPSALPHRRTQFGIVDESLQRVGEVRGVGRVGEDRGPGVCEHAGDRADRRCDDGQARRQVFVDLERGEVVLACWVRGDRDVEFAQSLRHRFRRQRTVEAHSSSQPEPAHLVLERLGFGAVADDVDAEVPDQTSAGGKEPIRAVPGFERADEPDPHRTVFLTDPIAEAVVTFRRGDPFRVHSVRDDADIVEAGIVSADPVRDEFAHAYDAFGSGEAGRGGAGGMFGVDESAVGALLVEQRRIDLHDQGHVEALTDPSPCGGEQGIPFVDEVETLPRGGHRVRHHVGEHIGQPQQGDLTLGAVEAARHLESGDVEIGEVGGHVVIGASAEDADLVTECSEGAHDLLNMDAGPLRAEDPDAWVEQDIGDSHDTDSISRTDSNSVVAAVVGPAATSLAATAAPARSSERSAARSAAAAASRPS